jgi:hypothetical protein
VSQTTTVSAPGRSAGGRTLAIVLAILGILAIILGVLYVAGALNSVHFLVGSHHKGSHTVRAGVSFVVGIVLLVLAWAAGRTRSS